MRTTSHISSKVLRLETLDEQRKPIGRSTGFVLKESGGYFLYACWHSMTGVDFLSPTPKQAPVSRDFVRAFCQDIEYVDHVSSVVALHGNYSVDVPLRDEYGEPRWLQDPNERPSEDLNAIGIRVPKFFDVVRLPIDDGFRYPMMDVLPFAEEDISSFDIDAGSDVVIVGYPYGYSAMDIESPEPVFLKRSIASIRTTNVGYVLLDAGGAEGMSGAPVIVMAAGRWWLLGIYTGISFPHSQLKVQTQGDDRHAALGLMAPLRAARLHLRVPGAK